MWERDKDMNKKHLADASAKPRTMISIVCGMMVEPRLAALFAADVTCRYYAARMGQD